MSIAHLFGARAKTKLVIFDLRIALAITVILVSVVARLRLDLSTPLWLDESWTGAFATQKNLADLTFQIRNDTNGPIYYYLTWAWVQFFGSSNISLRIPSVLLALMAPAFAWIGLKKADPLLALIWAALISSWMPGLVQSGQARCYALLLCFAVLSTVCHLRVVEQATRRRAAIWAACAATMTLIHYHAGILAFVQGIFIIFAHRSRSLRLWPAAFAFVPAFAWLAWHAPRLAEFGRIDVAWYDLVSMADVPDYIVYLLGDSAVWASAILALLLYIFLRGSNKEIGGGWRRCNHVIWWIGGAAVAAAAICIMLGMMRPALSSRYLTPFVPGILLLVAALIKGRDARRVEASTVLLAGCVVVAAQGLLLAPYATRRVNSFEAASEWLAQSSPRRLVFFWDHPATAVEVPSQLDAVAGFFLRRAGLPVAVTPIYPTADDMNGPIEVAAGSDAVVLWLYDELVHHTRARNFPPHLSELDPSLECRNFGRLTIGVVACRRR